MAGFCFEFGSWVWCWVIDGSSIQWWCVGDGFSLIIDLGFFFPSRCCGGVGGGCYSDVDGCISALDFGGSNSDGFFYFFLFFFPSS